MKIPIVHYYDNRRVVIGSAEVDMEDDELKFKGTIIDKDYLKLIMSSSEKNITCNLVEFTSSFIPAEEKT